MTGGRSAERPARNDCQPPSMGAAGRLQLTVPGRSEPRPFWKVKMGAFELA